MNELQQFNEQNIQLFQNLQMLKYQIKELTDKEESLKEELKNAFEKYGIKSIDNEFVKIQRIAESETKSIDLKEFQINEPDVYEELLNDYPKITKRRGYIRITVK